MNVIGESYAMAEDDRPVLSANWVDRKASPRRGSRGIQEVGSV